MDFDFTIKMKDMISYYLESIKIFMNSENLTPQEYFEKYGIHEQSKAKTSCWFAYNGRYLEFILSKTFSLGYLTNPSDDILKQALKELDELIKQGCFEDKHPIAESSADLD